MKIAIVIIGEGIVGGAERRLTNLFHYLNENDKKNSYYLILSPEYYSNLKRMNFQLDMDNVILLGKNNKNLDLNDFGEPQNINQIKDIILKNSSTTLKKYLYLLNQWRMLFPNTYQLYNAFKNLNINITYTIGAGAYATSIIKKIMKKPFFILSYMDVYTSNINNNFIYMPISYKMSFKHADYISFLGNTYYERIKEHGFEFPNNNYSIAPCSFINYKPMDITYKENLVVFAARLVEEKNPFLFIEVAELILKKRTDINFEMYGKGELDVNIRQYLKSRNLIDKIKISFTNNILEIFAKSKIFLSLQDIDNYPSQSILEAKFFENIVIATNVGESDKLVRNDTGYLTEFNPHEIAEKIEYIIDNPEIHESMAKTASKFVKDNHNVEKYADYILNIFQKFSNHQQ